MKVCKFQLDKECYNKTNECGPCGRNPNRFDNREITKGQILFLKSVGYSDEEISRMDYKTACREIERIKK